MACSRCADSEQGGCDCNCGYTMVEAARDSRDYRKPSSGGGGSYWDRADPRKYREPEEYKTPAGVTGTLEVYILAPIGRCTVHGKRFDDMDRDEHDAWRDAKYHVDRGDLKSGVEKIFPGRPWREGIAVTWRLRKN